MFAEHTDLLQKCFITDL